MTSRRGFVLIGAIAQMVLVGLFAAVATSVVTSSTGSHSHVLQGAQALALAHAGAEWYMEQLRADSDWTNEANQAKTFADGSFSITILSAAATQVSFRATGQVTSTLANLTLQRYVTMTAQKVPTVFKFALYQGLDPGANFELRANGANATVVAGDVWSRGSVLINSPNSVSGGKVYVPDNETVTGTGSYTSKLMSSPYLTMPVITTTYYTNLITSYNATLDANSSSTDRTVSAGTFNIATDAACSGGICNFRDFTTDGTVTITGNGTIVANRNIDLHSGAGSTSLTVSPSAGGTITFLANRDLSIGRTSNPTVSVASGCTFYSRAATATGQQITVRGTATTLNSALLLANRNITVESGADVIGDSTLFVNYPGSDTNNLIDINGASGVTSVDGTLISTARRTPGLRIRNGGTLKTNTSVTGLVYCYGSATTGQCQIDEAVIAGSVVCNRYDSNRVRAVAITHSTTALPATPPRGFENFVARSANSWDGL